jgi:hypothetical protein
MAMLRSPNPPVAAAAALSLAAALAHDHTPPPPPAVQGGLLATSAPAGARTNRMLGHGGCGESIRSNSASSGRAGGGKRVSGSGGSSSTIRPAPSPPAALHTLLVRGASAASAAAQELLMQPLGYSADAAEAVAAGTPYGRLLSALAGHGGVRLLASATPAFALAALTDTEAAASVVAVAGQGGGRSRTKLATGGGKAAAAPDTHALATARTGTVESAHRMRHRQCTPLMLAEALVEYVDVLITAASCVLVCCVGWKNCLAAN